jgi:hypothetical protein
MPDERSRFSKSQVLNLNPSRAGGDYAAGMTSRQFLQVRKLSLPKNF